MWWQKLGLLSLLLTLVLVSVLRIQVSGGCWSMNRREALVAASRWTFTQIATDQKQFMLTMYKETVTQ